MSEKRLFLLDAYALIYRAYYALMRSPRFTAKGLNTSAIFGFCNVVDEVVRKFSPDYLAVCFDPPGGHTFRHDAYPEYKAGREKQPEDITLAVPIIRRILQAMNIPAIEVPGFEADDIIGTLSRKAEREGLTTYMMTFDKDYGQLVTDSVFMYRPPLKGEGEEIRGPKQICERYGLENPRQIIDLLALEGDASDNVPGCPGVGEKTAIKLISEYGSVDNVIANAASIKGALGRKIEDNKEQIEFSKYLVTIRTDVPLDLSPLDFACRQPDRDALADIYRELEFRTLLARLGKTAEPAAPAPEKAEPARVGEPSLFDLPDEPAATQLTAAADVEFNLVQSKEEVAEMVAQLTGEKHVGIAVNAFGAEAMTASLRGVAVSASGRNWYVAVPDFMSEASDVMQALHPLLQSADATLVSDDIKRCMVIFHCMGIQLTAKYFDVGVAHYLLAPEGSHDLASMAATVLDVETPDYPLSATERRRMRYEAKPDSEKFFCQRAALSLQLVDPLLEDIEAQGFTKLLTDIEMPFVAVLAAMETEGVRIDTAELANMSHTLKQRLAQLEEQCYDMAGVRFNIASPAQVGEVLFDRMKIDPKAKRTKRGAWSTTEEILEKYAHEQPIVHLILEIRGLRKLLTTYVDALPKLINPRTGKIHTTFNQTVTATGRISSANPNLQNIPVRTDEGREIRRAFIPDKGDLMLSADYSQIELRLMADISGDPEMIGAFASGEDIHRATAAKIFHETLDAVTDNQRRAAKTANFGIIYGISAFGLAERLGIPRSEAKELIEGYFNSYPQVRSYIENTVAQAREKGYVSTIHGRKRFLPDINSRNATVRGYAERNAVNAPLQGSAADIIKVAMINIYREINSRKLRSRMIMQVHDELIFNVVPDEATEMQELVTRLMQQAYSGRVDLTVSCGIGDNWLEIH